MTKLDDHFRALTRVRPPDDWPDLDHHVGRPLRRAPLGRVGVASLALLVAASGAFLVVRAFDRPSRPADVAPSVPRTPAPSPPSPSPAEPARSPSPSSAPSRSSGPELPLPTTGVFGAMVAAIRDSSPPGWAFEFGHDRLDGDWRLDGHVDDGSGPGRLYVDVTVRAGMLTAHPCADPEFRQGGRCVERQLSGGDLLVLRDVVVGPGEMKTIEAVLVHPDRSGVGAEAGNWTLGDRPGNAVGRGALARPNVTRADPVYTVEQLAHIVRAVDERARSCLRSPCA